jgi:hypothetical protein
VTVTAPWNTAHRHDDPLLTTIGVAGNRSVSMWAGWGLRADGGIVFLTLTVIDFSRARRVDVVVDDHRPQWTRNPG